MKRAILLLMTAAMLAASAAPAFADVGEAGSRDAAVYHSNVPDTPIWRNREFWRNEKERSGLPEFWAGTKNFFRSLNPMPHLRKQRENYEARRVSS